VEQSNLDSEASQNLQAEANSKGSLLLTIQEKFCVLTNITYFTNINKTNQKDKTLS
jgi:hypothetical protein